MRKCEGCGVEFLPVLTRKTCSRKCAMRVYRKTPQGRAAVKEANKKHKRPDIDKVCQICDNSFITANKAQVNCSECSGSSLSKLNRNKEYREKPGNKAKIRARGIVNKRVARGTMQKELCYCGSEAQAHHPDYDKPLEVVWLCQEHHNDIPRKQQCG